jgi:uncharacterized protein (UPF0248 family)
MKWHEGGLERAILLIVHRGAPNNIKEIQGRHITELGRGFMTVGQGENAVQIPYHRIVKIVVDGKVVWERG